MINTISSGKINKKDRLNDGNCDAIIEKLITQRLRNEHHQELIKRKRKISCICGGVTG